MRINHFINKSDCNRMGVSRKGRIKDFPFNENRSLQFRAEAFNVTNTPTWGIPVNDLNNNKIPLGSITSTRSTERQLQLSLKLYF